MRGRSPEIPVRMSLSSKGKREISPLTPGYLKKTNLSTQLLLNAQLKPLR